MSDQVEIDGILADAEKALRASQAEVDVVDGEAPQVIEAPLTDGAVVPESRAGHVPFEPPFSARQGLGENLARILKISVPVIVRLACRSMRVREIMKLATGSIIEFDKPADSDLDLMVDGVVIGHGEAVKVGENFGLRVLHILSVREKIEALKRKDR